MMCQIIKIITLTTVQSFIEYFYQLTDLSIILSIKIGNLILVQSRDNKYYLNSPFINNSKNMLQEYFQQSSSVNTRRFVVLQKRVLAQYESKNKTLLLKQAYLTIEWQLETAQRYYLQKTIYEIIMTHRNKKILLSTCYLKIFQTWKKALLKIVPGIDLMKNIKQMRRIGSGNFSQVFRVNDQYGNVFALKAINKKKSQPERDKELRALQNEIDVMNTMSSVNLISLQAVYSDQKTFYLKLPFYEGATLTYLIKQKALTQNDIKKVMKDVLLGLYEMKKHKIVHRDIKPDNILMRQINGVRQFALIDFGLATYQNVDEYIYFRCGTPGYVAPEIANMSSKEQKMTVASDIFSLGAVFYLMLCKKPLFPGKNIESVLYRNRKCLINFSSAQFSKLRQKQKDLLIKMLQRDPEYRITPQQAMVHEYFIGNAFQQSVQSIPEEQNDMNKKMKFLNERRVKKDKNSILFLDLQSNSFSQQCSYFNGDNNSEGSKFLPFENLQISSMHLKPSFPQNKTNGHKKSSFLIEKNAIKK